MMAQAGDAMLARPVSARLPAKKRCLKLLEESETSQPTRNPENLLTEMQTVLEVLAFSACFFETIHELGIREFSELELQRDEVKARVTALFPVDDLAELDDRISSLFEVALQPQQVKEALRVALDVPLDKIVRDFQIVLAGCPIDMADKLGHLTGMAEQSHRCRIAYAIMQGFVRRNSPDLMEGVRIMGRAYSTGRLSLDEVSHLLGMSATDALFLLEECNYARSSDVIRLKDEDRNDALRRIREDRRARAGRPIDDPALVVRDVVSSERIEGVDARAWVTSHGK